MIAPTKASKAKKPAPTTKFVKSSPSTLAETARRRRQRVLRPVNRDPYLEMIASRKMTKRLEGGRARPRPYRATRNSKEKFERLEPPTRDCRVNLGGGAIANALFAQRIPERLQRPDLEDVRPEVLVQAGRDLSEEMEGLQSARKELLAHGQELYTAIANTVTSPIHATHSGELQKFMTISVPKNLRAEHMPTHVLAIHDGNPEVKQRKIHLVPTHAQILAAHCCRVPPLPTPTPPSPSLDPLDNDPQYHKRVVPLIPFCIPSPDTFPLVMHFLCTQDLKFLFRTLLPVCPSSGGIWDGDFTRLPEVLADMYTGSSILSGALRVYGVWQNACSLGVLNSCVWQVIDVAWKAHRNALLLARR